MQNILNKIQLDSVCSRENVENFLCASGLEVKRDALGNIEFVNYYNDDNELEKQVSYNSNEVSKIRYYNNGKVVEVDDYLENQLIIRNKYNKNGDKISQVKFEYDSYGRVISLMKRWKNREIFVKYGYDSLGRIVSRRIYIDKVERYFQEFKYDILNNLIEYVDINQQVRIENYIDNKLLSYTIKDSSGKETYIKNNFSNGKYESTKIVSFDQSYEEKNINYVDNVMLKKPIATEDDVDLTVSNLLKKDIEVNEFFKKDLENKSVDIVDEYIQIKIFPIAMRKRILYNLSLKTNV